MTQYDFITWSSDHSRAVRSALLVQAVTLVPYAHVRSTSRSMCRFRAWSDWSSMGWTGNRIDYGYCKDIRFITVKLSESAGYLRTIWAVTSVTDIWWAWLLCEAAINLCSLGYSFVLSVRSIDIVLFEVCNLIKNFITFDELWEMAVTASRGHTRLWLQCWIMLMFWIMHIKYNEI